MNENIKKTGKHQARRQDCDIVVPKNFDVPDRITGRNGVVELETLNPKRLWNFVEVRIYSGDIYCMHFSLLSITHCEYFGITATVGLS